MTVIFLGLFWMVAVDLYQSAKARKFFKEGYLEEKRRRREYRMNKLGVMYDQNKMRNDWYKWIQEDYARFDRIDHDNQQLKVRILNIKRTTKKDLLVEAHKVIIPTTTGSSTRKYFVHTKPKKYNHK